MSVLRHAADAQFKSGQYYVCASEIREICWVQPPQLRSLLSCDVPCPGHDLDTINRQNPAARIQNPTREWARRQHIRSHFAFLQFLRSEKKQRSKWKPRVQCPKLIVARPLISENVRFKLWRMPARSILQLVRVRNLGSKQKPAWQFTARIFD